MRDNTQQVEVQPPLNRNGRRTSVSKGRDYARDALTFIEILFFVPFVLFVLLPLRAVDNVLDTQLLRPIVRLTKYMANL